MNQNVKGTSRRAFLKQTISGVVLLGASETLLTGCAAPAHLVKKYELTKRFALNPAELVTLEAIAETLIPTLEKGEPTIQDVGVVARVDEMISWRDEAIQDEFRQLLAIFDSGFVSLFFNGIPKRFISCSPEQREAVLESWATSMLPIRRQGFMAVKRLCNIAYWTDERTWKYCGYDGPMGYLQYDTPFAPEEISPEPESPKTETTSEEQAG
ncbi:MAG: gluconate 2-dehydrogenase subunit 3 family protein [Deltaproteobacteria bacterium]|jgi:hypothetical protein|nr:gluconate 2-dehydrogenase subunit 3 family protein [Deltaproteobacteria bacterium]MBT6435834.1 gluconate 2-dehydrogenase subunit 3 family protein [Deltaproteobacteria bacterium]MBT6488831.1 gluconate 2-dehydrogenase subunit 3 family protein [Deltaproteobacteria bacterium]